MTTFVPRPASGRVYESEQVVRIEACDPAGVMRLDGMVRAMQNLSADDTADAQHGGDGWVVRRTAMRVERAPLYRERLSMHTFCGGLGRSWAERRVSIRGSRGAAIEGKTLWVHIDPATGRPRPLPARFVEVYGEAAQGRKVRARLSNPSPPDDATWRPWAFRYTDADMWGHVNNAAYWTAGVDVLARAAALPALASAGQPARAPLLATLDHGPAIDPDDPVEAAWARTDGSTTVWLRVGDQVRGSLDLQ